VVVPVVFDESLIAHDLSRLPTSAAAALRGVRDNIDSQGGLPTTRLKRCEVEGRDGARLPDCFKTYVPWEENKWGVIFVVVAHVRRPFALRAIAYGVRHPIGTTRSVYQIADRRLNPPS
jgi:hypothetical protein